MKLVTSAQMQKVDRETIDNVGIPGPELMENAGRGIAECIIEDLLSTSPGAKLTVLCGKGNNGGDGYVVARYLHEAGFPVDMLYQGPYEKLSDDARLNFDRVKKLKLSMKEITEPSVLPDSLDSEFIVDAIFGTGFSGSPRGITAEMIEYINIQPQTVIAVDMPSGLNADTGEAEGSVVEADYTYTLALPKFGLFVSPGRELAGVVSVVPIGIPDGVVEQFEFTEELITQEMVLDRMPVREPDGHKGTFGKVMVLSGSLGLTGAAALAAESALRTGSGLVKLASPKSVIPILAQSVIEATSYPLPEVAKKGALALRALGEARELAREHDAVIIGPGIGRHHETWELVRRFLSKLEKPSIVDADGLNALEGHTEVLKLAPDEVVITPHPGEFARLSGKSPTKDLQQRIADAREFADEHDVVVVLKGSPTVIADPEGTVYVNQTGNHGMATGGTGDVLSGMIGSLLGQGLDALDAAICAVYMHGLAGDLAADDITPRAMIAGDVIEYLGDVYEELGI
ncbi:NAD(P)H-hydrate dehydratase [candidate division GN15 bacterium]|nr:NAD(P)H-hydrate dehydratase [candidate division GN15 bacterium]